MSAPVLFEVHAVIREEDDLGLRAALLLNLAQEFVERAERDAEACGAADVQKAIGRLEEAEEIAGGRGREEALAEALHVRAPHGVCRDVDQKLERQGLLIVQLVHV